MNRLLVASFAVLLGSAASVAQGPVPAPNQSQGTSQAAEAGKASAGTQNQSPQDKTQFSGQIPAQAALQPTNRILQFDGKGVEPAASGGSLTLYRVPENSSLECPVSMHAEHGSGGGLVITHQSRSGHDPEPTQPSGPAQQIHLILGKPVLSSSMSMGVRVASAKVTVRGTNGKWRTVPAGLAGDASSEMNKTLDVTFRVAENGQVSADMTLPGFTSVKSISLDSLTYSNGSTWIPANGRACRVAPDPLMLVSSER